MSINMINTEFNFSLYNNLYSTKEPQGELDINQLIEIVRYGYVKEEIENLRNAPNKDVYNKIKQAKIPCATLSGIFTERNSKSLVQHSGLIQIDIDKVDDYNKLWNKLVDDYYTYVCFKSPGGEGIKVVVKINPDPITHLEQYYALEKHYLDTFNVKIDGACKDVGRCLLLSYDPDIFCNPFAEVFSECLLPNPPKQKQYTPNGNSCSIEVGSADTEDVINEITAAIESRMIDLTSSYENWIKIGFALSTELGEGGRNYYHKLSRFHPDYSPSQCDRQYSNLNSRNNGAISIGTLIYLAKESGIDLKMPSTHKTVTTKETFKTKEFNPKATSLEELLMEKRNKIAKEKRVPSYMIFPNKTISEIASKEPINQQEFETIKGVGLITSEKYAKYFLPIIRKYTGIKGALKLSYGECNQEQRSQTNRFTNKEQVLCESLREFRLQLSREEGMKAYWIFGNNTLNDLVLFKPTTKQQLLHISGIGQKKWDWFGQEVLDIIEANNSL